MGITLARGSFKSDLVHLLVNFIHGIIMGTQAIIDPAERGHLISDVAALFIAVVLFGWLTPRNRVPRTTQDEI